MLLNRARGHPGKYSKPKDSRGSNGCSNTAEGRANGCKKKLIGVLH
jgi:hypothetical protein